MRKHGRAMIEGAGLLLVGLLLFLFPEESVAAAREGISLCVDVLIPSLFPFFVLSSLLISTGLAGLCARPLESFMRPLFGVGGAGAAALSLGLIGGYPVGARTVAQLVQRRECSQTEARRLSLFCNNCGPAFFIGAAGVGVFGAKEAGFLLLGANLTAAVLLGILFHVFGKETAQEETRKRERPAHSPLTTEFPQCVQATLFPLPWGSVPMYSLFGLADWQIVPGLVALSGQRTFQFASWRKRPCFVPEFLCWPYGAFHRYRGHKGWGIFPFGRCLWRRLSWDGVVCQYTASLCPFGGRPGYHPGPISALNFCMASFPLV